MILELYGSDIFFQILVPVWVQANSLLLYFLITKCFVEIQMHHVFEARHSLEIMTKNETRLIHSDLFLESLC